MKKLLLIILVFFCLDVTYSNAQIRSGRATYMTPKMRKTINSFCGKQRIKRAHRGWTKDGYMWHPAVKPGYRKIKRNWLD